MGAGAARLWLPGFLIVGAHRLLGGDPLSFRPAVGSAMAPAMARVAPPCDQFERAMIDQSFIGARVIEAEAIGHHAPSRRLRVANTLLAVRPRSGDTVPPAPRPCERNGQDANGLEVGDRLRLDASP
jgi:hypothetical protein